MHVNPIICITALENVWKSVGKRLESSQLDWKSPLHLLLLRGHVTQWETGRQLDFELDSLVSRSEAVSTGPVQRGC